MLQNQLQNEDSKSLWCPHATAKNPLPPPIPQLYGRLYAACTCRGPLWVAGKEEKYQRLPGVAWGVETIRCAGVAGHLGEDSCPSPGIASPAGAGCRAMSPPPGGAAEESEESGVRTWALGERGGRRRQVRESARLRVESVHVVGVWLFHSNFGSLSSGVREGVTNQSSRPGINYANRHLAMGQMTPILFKNLPRPEFAV